MSEYVNCQNCDNKECSRYGKGYGYTFCNYYVRKKKMTNADRIRAMSDGELAVFLCAVKFRRETILNVTDFLYIKDAHDWLQQPAEEDAQ